MLAGRGRTALWDWGRRAVWRSERSLGVTTASPGEEAIKTYVKLRLRLNSEADATSFLATLRLHERQLLLNALKLDSLNTGPDDAVSESNGDGAAAVSPAQVKALFLINCLPFVGFGFFDNFIMIVAGEYIDAKLGVAFGLTTMAAAGFGNLISDVAGVGLAHQVEWLVGKIGIKAPALTPDQWANPKARRASNVGKVFGLVVGCIIGMFPLLFYRKGDKPDEAALDQEDKH